MKDICTICLFPRERDNCGANVAFIVTGKAADGVISGKTGDTADVRIIRC